MEARNAPPWELLSNVVHQLLSINCIPSTRAVTRAGSSCVECACVGPPGFLASLLQTRGEYTQSLGDCRCMGVGLWVEAVELGGRIIFEGRVGCVIIESTDFSPSYYDWPHPVEFCSKINNLQGCDISMVTIFINILFFSSVSLLQHALRNIQDINRNRLHPLALRGGGACCMYLFSLWLIQCHITLYWTGTSGKAVRNGVSYPATDR